MCWKYIVTICGSIILGLMLWTNPLPVVINNEICKTDIYNACLFDRAYKTYEIDDFTITLVANADKDCLNPWFPMIHITTSQRINGWIHVVQTDSDVEKWQLFIDAIDDYPFYNKIHQFADAPYWTYTLFSKPLTFWRGHVYPIIVEGNIIHIKSGIKWGFTLGKFSIKPTALMPLTITLSEVDQDMKFLQQKLGNKWRLEKL